MTQLNDLQNFGLTVIPVHSSLELRLGLPPQCKKMQIFATDHLLISSP